VGLAAAKALGLPETELHEAELRRRKVHNVIQDLKGQIRVFCRVRPLNAKERSNGDVEAVRVIDDMTIEVPRAGVYSFDGVFAPGSQEDVFEDCRDLVESAVDGHNVTIFAYGQTGAGKTYTMYGTPEKEGIASRAITHLFEIECSLRHRYAMDVTGSMIELYNNNVVDLLKPMRRTSAWGSTGSSGGGGTSSATLSVVTTCSSSTSAVSSTRGSLSAASSSRGLLPQAEKIMEQEVQDATELRALLERGLAQRTVAANAMNIESSRSHLIFTIRVTSTNLETGEFLQGKILLCDLGGSERLKRTEATGHQKKEAIEINKSLTALGDVIAAIAKKQKQVPYRNHKLTQIMQDSLGGPAKTLMFVNCSPALSNVHETTMSLNYAARVKTITNTGMRSTSRPASPHSRLRTGGRSTPATTPATTGATPTVTSSPVLKDRTYCEEPSTKQELVEP